MVELEYEDEGEVVEIDPLIAGLYQDLGVEGVCYYNHVALENGILCVAGPYLDKKTATKRVAAFWGQMPGVVEVYTSTSADLPGWAPGRQHYLISKSREDGTRIACGPFRSYADAKEFERLARKKWERAIEFPEGDVYRCPDGAHLPLKWVRRYREVKDRY